MGGRINLLLTICSTIVLAFPLGAETFEGRVRVIDGDTIDVGGTRVRLHGIDAPERDQICHGPAHRAFQCGEWVHRAVTRRYGDAWASCEKVDTDRYGRIVARCDVVGEDMGRWLVQEGLAFAFRRYSWDYDLDEKGARVNERGLHGFAVQDPSAFRAAKREVRGTAPRDPACPIKGNISKNGRIYHLPGQEFYAGTVVRPSQGERWFCSEAEARAAGWRRAKR